MGRESQKERYNACGGNFAWKHPRKPKIDKSFGKKLKKAKFFCSLLFIYIIILMQLTLNKYHKRE